MIVSELRFGLALVPMLGVLGTGASSSAFYKVAAPETATEQLFVATPKPEQEPIDHQEEPLPAGAVARLFTVS
jgi:hypothetical protein